MIIGEAAALGLAIDIPILVRSLAHSLPVTESGPSLLPYHESMVAALDNGLPEDDPCALVPTYACDWWNNEAEPDAADIMSSTNLCKLLARHESHRPISDLPPDHRASSRPASSLPVPPCSHCRQYRDLTAEAVNEMDSVRQFADAMYVSAEAIFDADMRRAQGFFFLHDAVQQKEMREIGTATASIPRQEHKGPTHIGGVNVHRKSQRAHATAKAELERLQQLPPASYKWTWGPQLTETEIIALLPPAGEPIPPHSGYDVSLPSGGWMRYPESSIPSMPNLRSSNRVSLVSGEDETPPLPESNGVIDRLGYRSKENQVQTSDNGSDMYVPDAELVVTWGAAGVPHGEQEQNGVNPKPVAQDADIPDAVGESDNESKQGDLASVWGKGAFNSEGSDHTTARIHEGNGEDQGSDNGSDIYVPDAELVGTWGAAAVPYGEQERDGINTEALTKDADIPDAVGESDTDLNRGDLASVWAQAGLHNHAMAPDAAASDAEIRAGNGDAEDDSNLGDLASTWAQGLAETDDEEAGDNRRAGTREGNGELDGESTMGDLVKAWGQVAQETDDEESHDLAPMSGKFGDADETAGVPPTAGASDGDGHPEESEGDLAAVWGGLGEEENHSPDCESADGDLADMWGGGGSGSDDAQGDNADQTGAGRRLDADAATETAGLTHTAGASDVQGHPEESEGDLAAVWGGLVEGENHSPDCESADGDLADMWGGGGSGSDDAEGDNAHEAGAARRLDAEAATEAVSDLTMGVTSVTPSRLTLTAQPVYTGVDFEFLSPRWLDPPPLPSPIDSDEEEDSDDGTSDGYSSGDDGYDEASDDEDAVEDNEGEAA